MDDSPFGGEIEGALRFEGPKGTEPQGVDGKDRLVSVAGNDGRRSLGQGAEESPVEEVHGLSFVVEGGNDMGYGREKDLHGLDQAEPELDHETFKGPVEVLGVAAAGNGRDPEHGRFPPELVDGVDLSVVAKNREGLDALRHREGVGLVPAVAQNERSLALGVLEIQEIVGEDETRALDLVNDDRRGEGGDMENSVPFETGAGLEGGMERVGPGRREEGHLPEMGLVVGEGGDPLGQGLALPDHQNLESFLPEDFFDEARLIVRMVAPQVEVASHKAGILDQGTFETFLLEPASPEWLWNVHLDPAAVSLVPDLSGSVLHLLKRLEGFMDQTVRSSSGLGEDGDDRTTVPFLVGKGSGEAGDRVLRCPGGRRPRGTVGRRFSCHLSDLG